MQTAKIKIGSSYAVMANGQLSMFKVTKIVNVRTYNGAENEIHGVVNGYEEKGTVKYSPDGIIGDYEEHAELVALATAKEKETKQAAEKVKADADDLVSKLYTMTGLERGKEKFREPIQSNYSGAEIRIGREAVIPILEALKRLGV